MINLFSIKTNESIKFTFGILIENMRGKRVEKSKLKTLCVMSIKQFSYVWTTGQKTIQLNGQILECFFTCFLLKWQTAPNSQLIVGCILNITQIWFSVNEHPLRTKTERMITIFRKNVNASHFAHKGNTIFIVVHVLSWWRISITINYQEIQQRSHCHSNLRFRFLIENWIHSLNIECENVHKIIAILSMVSNFYGLSVKYGNKHNPIRVR